MVLQDLPQQLRRPNTSSSILRTARQLPSRGQILGCYSAVKKQGFKGGRRVFGWCTFPNHSLCAALNIGVGSRWYLQSCQIMPAHYMPAHYAKGTCMDFGRYAIFRRMPSNSRIPPSSLQVVDCRFATGHGCEGTIGEGKVRVRHEDRLPRAIFRA